MLELILGAAAALAVLPLYIALYKILKDEDK